MSADRSQSLCLLTLDALRCTPMARSDAFDWTPLYDALTLVFRGNVTDDEERVLFSRLLDARWHTPLTASFRCSQRQEQPSLDQTARVRLHLAEDAHMDVCLPIDASPEMVEAFHALAHAAAEYLATTLAAKADNPTSVGSSAGRPATGEDAR